MIEYMTIKLRFFRDQYGLSVDVENRGELRDAEQARDIARALMNYAAYRELEERQMNRDLRLVKGPVGY